MLDSIQLITASLLGVLFWLYCMKGIKKIEL